jgi:two-component system response regulator DesR
MNRILLADNNPTLRSALALLLETRLGAQVVGQVSSMESLLCEAAATRPEIIIMDWELPGKPYNERIAALRQKTPYSRIIVTSARPENALQATDSDAFLCKTDPPEAILDLVQGS